MKYSLYHHNAMVDRGILDRTVNKSADLLQQSPNLSLSFRTASRSGTRKNMAETVELKMLPMMLTLPTFVSIYFKRGLIVSPPCFNQI